MGGGMGGMGGGMGIMGATMRAYQLSYIIQLIIEPESWYQAGGQGEIYPFSGTRLIVWQTPAVHEKIKKLIDSLRKLVGDQVAIETRFLLVGENFLEDIGLDVDITLSFGRNWSSGEGILFSQGSFEAVRPTATKIPGSFGSISDTATDTDELGLATGFSYDKTTLLDDLSVSFMLRATQMHGNSKVLTAPKLMVLNGESATMSVQQQRNYISNKTFNSETVAIGLQETSTVWWFDSDIGQLPTGITLSITPTITTDKKYVLLMIMTFLNDELTPGEGSTTGVVPGVGGEEAVQQATFELPNLQNTNLMTRVMVPDQGTVLLGGLTLTAEREIQSGVPVLSKIPILGRLFENRSKVKDRQVLLVLVKPTIILKEESEARAIAAMEQDNG